MAASVIYCGGFDLATYGSVSINWTDASGAHVLPGSVGKFTIGAAGLTMYTATSAASIAEYAHDFVAELVAGMDALTAQTVTGSFSPVTGLVTLACTGGLFTLSFVGAPGARMKALLGFTGAITGATSYTGPSHPYFCIRPNKPCVSGSVPPVKQSGRTNVKQTSDASRYRLAPITIPQVASWRHDFEPKAMVDRVWFDAGHSSDAALNVYTWEDLWDDYGDQRNPIFAIWYYDNGTIEYLAFDLTNDVYDRATHDRMFPKDDLRFKVMIAASLRARHVV